MRCRQKRKETQNLTPLKSILILIYLFHAVFTATAQEDEPPVNSQQVEIPDSGGSTATLDDTSEEADAGSGEAPEKSPQDLIRETIYLDISTSSFYELQNWLNNLGLEVTGSKSQLENRLLRYYRELLSTIPEDSTDGASAGTGETEGEGRVPRRMEIESAGRLEYLSSENGEELVKLSGGVVLQMKDVEENTLHTVKAQSLVFNRSRNLVSAIGDVRYEMETGDSSQDFEGEEITFHIENYRGVFIQGLSRQVQQIEGQEILFYFQGDAIYRIQRDTIRLEGGIISSSKMNDPYYHIAADNVWLLGIDEWALSDALLFIGHLPVFYIPFFYHPGDTLMFHPSFGMRSLEGYFIQTSTYFLGSRPKTGEEQDGFSFLQAVDSREGEYSEELRGFFLHRSREAPEENWANESGSYGRIQLDYYTRLGLLGALYMDLKDIGKLKQVELTAGFGYTNYIYPLSGFAGIYTPFQYDEALQHYTSVTQEPYVLGHKLPLRFGFDLQLQYVWKDFEFSLYMPFYTDLLLRDQLSKRSEDIGWTRLLNPQSALESASFEEYEDPVFSQHSSFNLSFLEKASFIDLFSFDKFDSKLYLSQSELPEDDGSSNKLGYYYPELATPLELGATIRGSIFKSSPAQTSSGSGIKEDEPEAETPQDLRPPWTIQQGQAKSEPMPEEEYKLPDLEGDIPLEEEQLDGGFSHSLSYVLNPDFSYHTQFDTDEMDSLEPEKVNFSPRYSYIFSDGNASLFYKAKFLQDRFHFTQTTRMRGRYRNHFDGAQSDLEDLLTQDRELSYFSILGNTELQHFFLPTHPYFSDSRMSYKIESEMLDYSYDRDLGSFRSNLPHWDSESISSHSGEMELIYDRFLHPQSFKLSYRMPPQTQKVDAALSLWTGSLQSELQLETEEDTQGNWGFGPFTATETFHFWDESRVAQELSLLEPDTSYNFGTTTLDIRPFPGTLEFFQRFEWNFSDVHPQNSITSLQLGWWTTRYESRFTEEYIFDDINGWTASGEEAFQPYLLSSSLKIPYEAEPFWKNRIRFETDLETSLQLNMIRYNESVLQFSWDLSLQIAEFLDFDMSVKSANNAIFRYIPAYSEAMGEDEALNIWEDFLNSFRFSDIDARTASNFNLQSISFSLIHYMHDWRLYLQYSGLPELNEDKIYRWRSEFSIFVEWDPIPEVKKEIAYDENGLQF